jgi:hypothetical protein
VDTFGLDFKLDYAPYDELYVVVGVAYQSGKCLTSQSSKKWKETIAQSVTTCKAKLHYHLSSKTKLIPTEIIRNLKATNFMKYVGDLEKLASVNIRWNGVECIAKSNYQIKRSLFLFKEYQNDITKTIRAMLRWKSDTIAKLSNSTVDDVTRDMSAFKKAYDNYRLVSAKKRKLEWNISKDEFYKITKEDCFYCKRHPCTIFGLDRLNNDVGYTLENVVSCCTECNMMKNVLEKDKFIAICNLIAVAHPINEDTLEEYQQNTVRYGRVPNGAQKRRKAI